VLVAATLAAALGLPGCATQAPLPPAPRPAPPVAATTPPAPPPDAGRGTQVGTTASGGTITVHSVPDSTPSPEALEVLRSIPEPLGGPARSDTAAWDSAGLPVPPPVRPLGDGPGASPAPAPAAPPSGDTSPGSGEPCWRVQVGSSSDAAQAARLAEAARSQLVAPFVVEKDGGLSKVRSRDCLGGSAATDLRDRAIASGFAGAFRFTGGQP
jgi:hypothetical protein